MAELNHVGLTVKNLERSLAFYRGVIGMKEGVINDLKSKVYLAYTNNPEAHIKFMYLTSDNFMLQLIEYVEGGGNAQSSSITVSVVRTWPSVFPMLRPYIERYSTGG